VSSRVADPAALDWTSWGERSPTRGRAEWKDLIGSEGISLGLGRVAPGEELALHSHPQPEAYLVLAGTAFVEIDGEEHQVGAGSAIFIPGGSRHACRNREDAELRFAFVFAADSAEQVEYDFPAERAHD
jgi:quercetin dioxygenase-like cupin family protein